MEMETETETETEMEMEMETEMMETEMMETEMETETETEMEMGKVHDVVSLFSTPQRDFLINKNGEKVKVDSLKGKIVAIYFVSLVEKSTSFLNKYASGATRTLKEVYHDLSRENNFQVVLVAQVYDKDERQDKELFDELFSRMPWLAIPQDDKESRRELFGMIGSEFPPVCPILDDKGKIVNPDAIHDLDVYGAECYPFTPERISEIDDDDEASRRYAMSLERLLTTPNRDFLIRSNAEKVPVSHLEGKVVAFYSCTGCDSKTVEYLIELYEKLRQGQKEIEIVFINSRETEDEISFRKAFRRTPWLGFPTNDRSYLKLMRIFRCDIGQLVIVSPGENFPDTYGLDVIRHYGIEAYPFTRQTVIENEVERLESLTLESILFSGRCKYIEGNSGQKITAHHLENKTILLLFTKKKSSACHQVMPKLIKWYNETKKKVKEDFEIIHIPYDYDPAKECCYGTMPWLRVPYDEKYSERLFRKTLDPYPKFPMIIAFGADGKILSMEVERKFLSEEWESKIEYPFTHVDFYEEVKLKVSSKMNWPVEGHEPEPAKIHKSHPWLKHLMA